MMNSRKPLLFLLVLTLLLASMFGYGAFAEDAPAEVTDEVVAEVVAEPVDEVAAEDVAPVPEEEAPAYSYSEGIDENGLWAGVKALDYVTLNDELAILIPSATHQITDDAVEGQLATIVTDFTTNNQVMDRPVADGDTVNIDYVGSVDGVEFDGGSTGGGGTDVTIGVTSYIDDFLQQLIGHNPGETIDVNVTFPEEYGVEALNGKDALFVTTINYISETSTPEMTDEFVAENLATYYNCTTVEDLKEAIRQELKDAAIQAYIESQISSIGTVSTVPEQVLSYQENAMVNYYNTYAGYYGVDLDTFLKEYAGLESVEALIESNYDNNLEMAKFYLVSQAIAEKLGITVGDSDVAEYFLTRYNTADYSTYETQYGMPYLKQSVLCTLAMDHLIENAVME